MARKHLVAVNRAVKAAGLDPNGIDGPTIELARDLARKIDDVGADKAGTRLTDAYLSATGRLQRAATRVMQERARAERARPAAEAGASDGETPVLRAVPRDPLSDFQSKHLGAAAS